MITLVITGIGSTIPNDLVCKACELIQRNSDVQIIEAVQLTGEEVSALISSARQVTGAKLKEESKVQFKDVESAITFLTKHFGDPLDNPQAFRTRFNAAYYRETLNNTNMRRLKACIEIMSVLHVEKNVSQSIAALLKQTGFDFVPEFCHTLLRFENM